MDRLSRARSRTNTPAMYIFLVIAMIVTCTITQFNSLSKYSLQLKHLSKEVREANQENIVETIQQPTDGEYSSHLLEPKNTLDSQQDMNHTEIPNEVVSLANEVKKSQNETFFDKLNKNQEENITQPILEPTGKEHFNLLEPNNTLNSQQNINQTKISYDYEVLSSVNDTNKSEENTFSDHSKKNQTDALQYLNITSNVADGLVSAVY